MCAFVEIILTDSNLFFYLYAFLGNPQLLIITLKSGVDAYFTFYNRARFHQSLDYSVPDEMYESFQCNELEYNQAV